MDTSKPFEIPKQSVRDAWRLVKANQGAAGVDGQRLARFEADRKTHRYTIGNRMSSGRYVPPPVKAVNIPKKAGGSESSGCPPWPIASPRLVVYGDAAHADPWFLLVAPGLEDRPWGAIVAAYGQRFTCEEPFALCISTACG